MPRKIAFFVLTASLIGSASTASAEGYGETIGMKAASGFANMGLGWIEIPKNVINTSNEWNNVLFGMTGGLVKGTLHMLGRTVSGVVDLVTFPLPTQPIAQPPFVWQNFTMETQYGPIFKLQSQSRTPQAAMPPAKR